MESTELYQDDLTEERLPTPAQRDDVAQTLNMDDESDDDDLDDDDLDDEDELDDDED